jgi:hypothetical protein
MNGTESSDERTAAAVSAHRVLKKHGFFAYSGDDGDLYRKHGVAGWRVSVHGNHAIRIDKKGRPVNGRNTWTAIREWRTEPDAADGHTPIEDVGELPPEAIEDFEVDLIQLVEDGELPVENEQYVYEPKEAGDDTDEGVVSQIISDAVDDFIEDRSPPGEHPTDPVEINSGHADEFANYVLEEYELPDGAERVYAFWAHSWIHHNGQHFDAEHPDGVDRAANLSIWERLMPATLSNVAEVSEHINEHELVG